MYNAPDSSLYWANVMPYTVAKHTQWKTKVQRVGQSIHVSRDGGLMSLAISGWQNSADSRW